MNFYKIQFQSGKKIEIKAGTDDQAVKRASNLITRWNQPNAIIFRVNPFNAAKTREISTLHNGQYNSGEPSLESDPKELYISHQDEKKARKNKRRERKSGSGEAKSSGSRNNFEVPLKDVAEKAGVKPTALRRKLRGSDIVKPEGGWGWNSWEHPDVVTILEWYRGD